MWFFLARILHPWINLMTFIKMFWCFDGEKWKIIHNNISFHDLGILKMFKYLDVFIYGLSTGNHYNNGFVAAITTIWWRLTDGTAPLAPSSLPSSFFPNSQFSSFLFVVEVCWWLILVKFAGSSLKSDNHPPLTNNHKYSLPDIQFGYTGKIGRWI